MGSGVWDACVIQDAHEGFKSASYAWSFSIHLPDSLTGISPPGPLAMGCSRASLTPILYGRLGMLSKGLAEKAARQGRRQKDNGPAASSCRRAIQRGHVYVLQPNQLRNRRASALHLQVEIMDQLLTPGAESCCKTPRTYATPLSSTHQP